MSGKYLHGIHGEGADGLYAEGWLIATEELGLDPYKPGKDYRGYQNKPIVRLNHGYGSAGTIPRPPSYELFAMTVAGFVGTSSGCSTWIIGNEPNHSQERPQGQLITPQNYALCYRMCRNAIHALPGHENDKVLLAAVAPWNVESGDWLMYYTQMLAAVDGQCDGFDLHTYTHGADPALITSRAVMNPPYQDRFYHFLAYQNTLGVIPSSMRRLPAYLTETDQNDPWQDQNSGWVKRAYAEVNAWNQGINLPKIHCLALYRWEYDKWAINNKPQVQQDFLEAVAMRYFSPQPVVVQPPANPNQNFSRCLAFVLRWEGGWADNPADPGGATMKGITLATYTRWREAHGQPAPSKDDLRQISDAEVGQIYYEWYWQESSSDALPWPLCLANFDLAVNGGVIRAQEALNAVGHDFYPYMIWRIEWYTRIDNFEVFGRAWIRRCADLMREAVKA